MDELQPVPTQDASPPLMINPNVEIKSVRELPAEIRRRLGGSDTDFIVSEIGARLSSQRIDSETASFLRMFVEPRRIVDAVVAHAATVGEDPAEVLEGAYPLINALRTKGVLLEAASAERRRPAPHFSLGDVVAGLRIVDSVLALFDTEVYRADMPDGTPAAIKWVNADASLMVREALEREHDVLLHLERGGVRCVPRVLAANFESENAYLVLEWCDGKTAFRFSHDPSLDLALRGRVVANLVAAFVSLHACDVLHGDVQPNNVIVCDDGSVRLLDFGGAFFPGSTSNQRRVGLVSYYEPEVAEAMIKGQLAPPATPAGEQYAVAALAYEILAGHNYLVLSLESDLALRQIAHQSPRRFAEFGLTWPTLECVLRRALRKNPGDRYSTFASFANALRKAVATTRPVLLVQPATEGAAIRTGKDGKRDACERTAQRLLERFGMAAELTRNGLSTGPTASIYHGAAGIAYALLRMAVLRESIEALAAADVWITRALHQQSRSDAFVSESVGLRPGMTGPRALFHSVTGLHVVNALARHLAGATTEVEASVDAFIGRILKDNGNPPPAERFACDATNGAASLLLGASLLLPMCPQCMASQHNQLVTLGNSLATTVRDEVAALLTSRDAGRPVYLGFAHGAAGSLYAFLRWAEVAQQPVPKDIVELLDDLAAASVRCGAGRGWPLERSVYGSAVWSGWCHGSAGYILLWTLAARVCSERHYLALAQAAGRHIIEARGGSGHSLCCGLAGEALALFQLGRATTDESWFASGKEVARACLETDGMVATSCGLFKGEVGVELMALEALRPETASWPICQSPL